MKYHKQGIRAFYSVFLQGKKYKFSKWYIDLLKTIGEYPEDETPAGTVLNIIDDYGTNNE